MSRSGSVVLLVRLDLADVEQARLVRVVVELRFDEQRRRLVLADDVREVVDGVDRRLGCAQRDHRLPAAGASGSRPSPGAPAVRATHRVPGAADERAGRRAGQQERADDECEHADDRRPGRPEQRAEELLRARTEHAAVRGAERGQQPERRHDQAGPERADVDERAARDHQAADGDERDGRDVGSGADHRREAVGDPAADHASAPAEVEDEARKIPSATSPSPVSSRCCWLFGFPFRVRFLTREGKRGLKRALLSAARHGRASPSTLAPLPTRKLRLRSGDRVRRFALTPTGGARGLLPGSGAADGPFRAGRALEASVAPDQSAVRLSRSAGQSPWKPPAFRFAPRDSPLRGRVPAVVTSPGAE